MRLVAALVAAAGIVCAAGMISGEQQAKEIVQARLRAAEAFRVEHISKGKRHTKVSAAVRDAKAHQERVEAALPAPWRAVIDAARSKAASSRTLHGRSMLQDPGNFDHPLEAPLECYTATGGRVDSSCCNAYWTADAACPANVTSVEDALRDLRHSAGSGYSAISGQIDTTNGVISDFCSGSCHSSLLSTFDGVASETGRGCPKVAYSIAYLRNYMCVSSGSSNKKCLTLENNPWTSSVFNDADELGGITPGNATLACGCKDANKARLDAQATFLQTSDWSLIAQVEDLTVSAEGLRAVGFAMSAGPRAQARTMGWACSSAPGSNELCVNEAVAQGAVSGGDNGGDDDDSDDDNDGGFGLFEECAWDFTCSFCGKTLMGHYLGFIKSTTDNACALSEFTTAANNGTADAELAQLCRQSPVDAGNQGAAGNGGAQGAQGAQTGSGPGSLFGSIISILETIMSLACGRAPNGQICANFVFGQCDANGQASQNALIQSVFGEDCSIMSSVALFSALGVSESQQRALLPEGTPASVLTDCSSCQTTLRQAATEWGCCITGYQQFIIQTFTELIGEDGTLNIPAGGDDDDSSSSSSGSGGPDFSGLVFRPPARPTAVFASRLNSLCGTDLPNGKCAGRNAATLTARLTNVDYDWVTGTQERQDQFVQRFVEVVSANTGAGVGDVTVDGLSRGSVRVAYTIRAETDDETTRIANEMETLLPASGNTATLDWSIMDEYLASSCVSATDCPCTGGTCTSVTAEGSTAAIAEANDDFSESAAAPILASFATLVAAIAAAFALRQ